MLYLFLTAHPKWIHVPNDILTITGHQIEVHCTASGSPLPKITWNKISGIISRSSILL